jgi:hypothetical protein
MGRHGHVFLSTGGDDGGVAQLDVLGTQSHGTQARPADLVDAPGRAFLGKPCIDMRLARGVLALCGGQHLAQDGFGHFALVDPGAVDQRRQNGGAKIMRGGVGEGSAEAADAGAGGGCDNYVGHGSCPLALGAAARAARGLARPLRSGLRGAG